MSEDFLSRWSHRKREAAAAAKDPKASPVEGERSLEREAKVADAKASTPGGKRGEPEFDLASLPPLESITAATDIRPFLRPGVPADLARAALRRAWTADPAIRNFVGLADYDWDYHTPGSMAGFGPLEMTDALRQVVARIIGDLPAGRAADAPSDLPKPAELSNDIKGKGPAPRSDARASNGDPVQDVVVHRQDVASNARQLQTTESQSPAMQQGLENGEDPPSIAHRPHGRALPK